MISKVVCPLVVSFFQYQYKPTSIFDEGSIKSIRSLHSTQQQTKFFMHFIKLGDTTVQVQMSQSFERSSIDVYTQVMIV